MVERASAPPLPWRKVLYEEQVGYPDNYTDETFLTSVLTSIEVPPLDLLALAKDSSVVAQQLSVVAAFCVVYLHVYYGELSAELLIGLESLLLLTGWMLRRDILRIRPTSQMLRHDLRRLVLLVGWLLCLSPVFATLTRTFSDDTICALTIALFVAHLVLHDYQYVLNYSRTFRGSTSMNAAIFASVLLAARLPSTPLVFATMALATQAFVLLPEEWRSLNAHLSSRQHLAVAAVVVVLTASLLVVFVSNLIASAYLFGIITISGLCPWLLSHLQRNRSLTGMWDATAVVQQHAQQPTRTEEQTQTHQQTQRRGEQRQSHGQHIKRGFGLAPGTTSARPSTHVSFSRSVQSQ
jgi:phosphatidylinositol glycan class C protein